MQHEQPVGAKQPVVKTSRDGGVTWDETPAPTPGRPEAGQQIYVGESIDVSGPGRVEVVSIDTHDDGQHGPRKRTALRFVPAEETDSTPPAPAEATTDAPTPDEGRETSV